MYNYMLNILYSAIYWVKSKIINNTPIPNNTSIPNKKNSILSNATLYIYNYLYRFIFNGGFFITQTYIHGKLYAKKMYIKYPFCKWTWDKISYINNSINSYFIKHKIEPNYDIWCNKIVLKKTNNTYSLYEKYNYYYEEDNINNHAIAYILSEIFYNKVEKNNENTLVIFKYKNKQIIQNNKKPEYDITNNYNFTPTSYRFITVQYIKKDISITLDIPKSMYIINNILFTPEFVFRCLLYQEEPFEFDIDYTLKIIDQNINMFEIRSYQYILLEKDTYKVLLL